MERRQRWLTHPKSFFELIIAGFSLVALPLIVALITGAFYVDKLSNQSQEAVYRAVLGTQASRQLLKEVGSMQRSIRQYFVLGDQELYQSYLKRHEAYVDAASTLSLLLLDEGLKERLRSLNFMEQSLYERLAAAKTLKEAKKVNPQEFITLSELAQAILRDSSQLIDSEVEIMQGLSSHARTIILLELMAVVPGAVIFIIVFVVLLSRPIRQIDNAIRKLGAGEFGEEITVSGPRDLEYLGERLNWLRARLKYLEEKKTKFLHYVSHELKTPLTAVRESAELLSEGVTGPLNEHQREVTDILKKNSISLQKMIEKLLSFNMPGQATLSSGLANVDLRDTIYTVIADHKPIIMAKDLRLSVKGDDVSLIGDEEQIRVIMDNLISNAVKHTPEHGSITLTLSNVQGKARIDVMDTGPGIHPSDKNNIFEAFYRGAQVEKGLIKGSGLGLSIVREFVEAHQGTIEVLEPANKKGAFFRVTLPTGEKEKEVA